MSKPPPRKKRRTDSGGGGVPAKAGTARKKTGASRRSEDKATGQKKSPDKGKPPTRARETGASADPAGGLPAAETADQATGQVKTAAKKGRKTAKSGETKATHAAAKGGARKKKKAPGSEKKTTVEVEAAAEDEGETGSPIETGASAGLLETIDETAEWAALSDRDYLWKRRKDRLADREAELSKKPQTKGKVRASTGNIRQAKPLDPVPAFLPPHDKRHSMPSQRLLPSSSKPEQDLQKKSSSERDKPSQMSTERSSLTDKPSSGQTSTERSSLTDKAPSGQRASTDSKPKLSTSTSTDDLHTSASRTGLDLKPSSSSLPAREGSTVGTASKPTQPQPPTSKQEQRPHQLDQQRRASTGNLTKEKSPNQPAVDQRFSMPNIKLSPSKKGHATQPKETPPGISPQRRATTGSMPTTQAPASQQTDKRHSMPNLGRTSAEGQQPTLVAEPVKEEERRSHSKEGKIKRHATQPKETPLGISPQRRATTGNMPTAQAPASQQTDRRHSMPNLNRSSPEGQRPTLGAEPVKEESPSTPAAKTTSTKESPHDASLPSSAATAKKTPEDRDAASPTPEQRTPPRPFFPEITAFNMSIKKLAKPEKAKLFKHRTAEEAAVTAAETSEETKKDSGEKPRWYHTVPTSLHTLSPPYPTQLPELEGPAPKKQSQEKKELKLLEALEQRSAQAELDDCEEDIRKQVTNFCAMARRLHPDPNEAFLHIGNSFPHFTPATPSLKAADIEEKAVSRCVGILRPIFDNYSDTELAEAATVVHKLMCKATVEVNSMILKARPVPQRVNTYQGQFPTRVSLHPQVWEERCTELRYMKRSDEPSLDFIGFLVVRLMRSLALPELVIELLVNRIDLFLANEPSISTPQFIRLIRLIFALVDVHRDAVGLAGKIMEIYGAETRNKKIPLDPLKAALCQMAAALELHLRHVFHDPKGDGFTYYIGSKEYAMPKEYLDDMSQYRKMEKKARKGILEWMHAFLDQARDFESEEDRQAFWEKPLISADEFVACLTAGWVRRTTHASFTLIRFSMPERDSDADDKYDIEVLEALLSLDIEQEEREKKHRALLVHKQRVREAVLRIWRQAQFNFNEPVDLSRAGSQDRWRWAAQQLRLSMSRERDTKPAKPMSAKQRWKNAIHAILQSRKAGLDVAASVHGSAPRLRWKKAFKQIRDRDVGSSVDTAKNRWKKAFWMIRQAEMKDEEDKDPAEPKQPRPSTDKEPTAASRWKEAFTRVKEGEGRDEAKAAEKQTATDRWKAAFARVKEGGGRDEAAESHFEVREELGQVKERESEQSQRSSECKQSSVETEVETLSSALSEGHLSESDTEAQVRQVQMRRDVACLRWAHAIQQVLEHVRAEKSCQAGN